MSKFDDCNFGAPDLLHPKFVFLLAKIVGSDSNLSLVGRLSLDIMKIWHAF